MSANLSTRLDTVIEPQLNLVMRNYRQEKQAASCERRTIKVDENWITTLNNANSQLAAVKKLIEAMRRNIQYTSNSSQVGETLLNLEGKFLHCQQKAAKIQGLFEPSRTTNA